MGEREQRRARLLIGWMGINVAQSMLAEGRSDTINAAHDRERIERAHTAVSSRSPKATYQADNRCTAQAVKFAEFASSDKLSHVGKFIQLGWQAQVVDLSKIHAAQQYVVIDPIDERIRKVDSQNFSELSEICFPVSSAVSISYAYDSQTKTHIVYSGHPNLRVLGHFPVSDDPNGVNHIFAIGAVPSNLSVAVVDGKYILFDGYHRAYSFLREGFTVSLR